MRDFYLFEKTFDQFIFWNHLIRKLFNIKQDNGFSENEIQKACEKHGNLPLVLQEYYRQLGNYKLVNRAQNILSHPDELIDTKEYLIFYKENQYVVQWAIKKSDLNKENPADVIKS